ncbi:MAG: hypothetical protein K0U74_03820 [Alphaproteobacteria bacterium]|nr:hypothetical protein [Alphaproteobacteria bacterium]
MRALWAWVGLVFLLLSPSAGYAGKCLESQHSIPMGNDLDGNPQSLAVTDYLCRSNTTKVEGLRVRLLRITEFIDPLMNMDTEPVAAGMATLIDNAKLFKGKVHAAYKGLADVKGRLPFSHIGFHLPGLDTAFRDEKTWPENFNLNYDLEDGVAESDVAKEILSGTRVWRYLTADDVAKFKANWQKKHGEFSWTHKLSLEYLEHVTRDNVPENFMVIESDSPVFQNCDEYYVGGYSFSAQVRKHVVDFAVISNTSDKAMSIESLVGAMTETPRLRDAADSTEALKRAAVGKIGIGFQLAAGEARLVPLRILLVDENYGQRSDAKSIKAKLDKLKAENKKINKVLKKKFRKRANKEKVLKYALIDYSEEADIAANPKVVFVEKKRGAFRKPKFPKLSTFVFGPEIHLAGFVVNGERIFLKGDNSNNFLEFTSSSTYGSGSECTDGKRPFTGLVVE